MQSRSVSAFDLLHLVDQIGRQADGAALVGDGAHDSLADPPVAYVENLKRLR
jgi:hypothetical protein